jgi:hypothetical protein
MNEAKLLTILIPTRNRPSELRQLVRTLNAYFRDSTEVEVIISDNSDIPLDMVETDLDLSIIRAPTRFNTLEEHLFYGLQFVRGEYVWPLGDDDIPTSYGVKALMDIVRSGIWDACTWNSRNLGDHGMATTWSRVDCQNGHLEMSYSDFLNRIGCWSIAAGVSLTIFKKKLIDNTMIDLVNEIKSPIYSHVVLYALLFEKARFAFVNHDLVLYRTHRNDIELGPASHWKNYSESNNHFFRFPWTLGFIRHLKMLHDKSILPIDYLSSALEMSDHGHRYQLLDNMIDMFLEQLESDLMQETAIPMKNSEIIEILTYFEIVAPELSTTWRFVRDVTETESLPRKSRINSAKQMRKQRRSLSTAIHRFPFNRYYRGLFYQHVLFETPLGWIAFPQNSEKIDITDALLGIEFPRYYEKSASSRAGLEIRLIKLKECADSEFDRIRFFRIGQDIQNYRHPEFTVVEDLWFSLPTGIKGIYQSLPMRFKRIVRKIIF